MIKKLKAHSSYLAQPAESFDFAREKWGVLFLNMGAPESLDDIEAFLYRIFCDSNIIRLPLASLLQKPLARLISSRRSEKVKQHYEAIGGESPLLKWTLRQACGVRRLLEKNYPEIEVFVGMRYSSPFIVNSLDAAVASGCKHVVIVSLYPQYSLVTTGTAIAEVTDWLDRKKHDVTVSLIDGFHNRLEYISLLKSKIEAARQKLPGDHSAKLLFSAHSLPVKMVEGGDLYVDQVRETVALAAGDQDHLLSFQSRSGPVKWVGPETSATIQQLGADGVKSLIIVPISFVSDHLETLYEVDIELAELAHASGIENFIRTESFNDDAAFIALLSRLVGEKTGL
ncbi:MAG: ferrochelatase [candidate division Zixibacteria bacterium]|nr:ferrochelatase [candidate division Zixibacteria bacterium]MBU1471803.1 ferrochelatase [candidate division Zixibacteria bacterium]MBU2626895.1 ferrochelatase [candidate division Zixibacteria bacterium]